MKCIRCVQAGGVLVLVLATLLVGLAVRPARATNASPRQVDHATQQLAATTAVNAEVYITLGTLQPIFANRISQQVPVAFSSAIARNRSDHRALSSDPEIATASSASRRADR